MLDTFIIDRIRREEERKRERAQVPLRIERMPQHPEPDVAKPERRDDAPRGSVVIDFRL